MRERTVAAGLSTPLLVAVLLPLLLSGCASKSSTLTLGLTFHPPNAAAGDCVATSVTRMTFAIDSMALGEACTGASDKYTFLLSGGAHTLKVTGLRAGATSGTYRRCFQVDKGSVDLPAEGTTTLELDLTPISPDADGCFAGASCSNGIKDGAETDTDCGGGTCPKCADGKHCGAATDCASNVCNTQFVCTSGTCKADGKTCTANAQCCSAACLLGDANRSCGPSPGGTCADAKLTEGESDVDCGGGLCKPCSDGLACRTATDCDSNVCMAGICRPRG